MPKFKVLDKFRDIHTKEVYIADQEIELSEERAEEVDFNLSSKGVFIERIQDEFDREAAKEKLKELGIDFKGNSSNETLKQLLESKREGE